MTTPTNEAPRTNAVETMQNGSLKTLDETLPSISAGRLSH
jgi:hypothetical protein